MGISYASDSSRCNDCWSRGDERSVIMNARSSSVEQGLEWLWHDWARLDARHPRTGRNRRDRAVHTQSADAAQLASVIDKRPQGISELTSPLSD